jgi:hypothetical protein
MTHCQRCGNPEWHVSIQIGKVGFRWKWIDLCFQCDRMIRKAKKGK